MPVTVATILILLLTLAPFASASSSPQVVDPPGDANGVDGLGDTRPVSYDAGDLLSMLWETTYAANPIGEDGVDHEATGLRLTIETLAAVDSTAATIAVRPGFDMPGCFSTFEIYLQGQLPDQQDPWDRYVEWYQSGASCPDTDGLWVHNPAWTVGLDGRRLVLTLPYASMNAAEREFLGVGRTIERPRGLTSFFFRFEGSTAWFPWIDFAAAGEDFVIGSDVPPDVPCTRGCPGG